MHPIGGVVACAYAAGLRATETVSLKVANIDGERGVIRIEHGKGGKDRNVMLSAQLLHYPAGLLEPQDWLFPGREESKPIDVQSAFRLPFGTCHSRHR